MTTIDEPPALRIAGPADLVQAVPYLLGFHPEASLVLVGLDGRRLVVTSRLDVDDVAADDVLGYAVRGLANARARSVIAAVYDERSAPGPDGPPWRGLPAHLEQLCDAAGLGLDDVLLVCAGRWWSLQCHDRSCCPPEGRALPQSPPAVVAAATYAGLVALPGRASLEALLAPVAAPERRASRALLAAAERECAHTLTAAQRRSWELRSRRELLSAARAADGGTLDLDPAAVARLGVALHAVAVRDALWTAADADRIDGRELWRDLARRLSSPYDAAPLFLYGWASWRRGDGALANIACDRATASDPAYSAADLLRAALAHGLDPRRVPRMRLRHSA